MLKKLKAKASELGATIDEVSAGYWLIDAPCGFVWKCDHISSLAMNWGHLAECDKATAIQDALERMAEGLQPTSREE